MLSKDEEIFLKDMEGDSLEMEVEMKPDEEATFGLSVRCSPDETEQTHIFFSRNRDQINIDYKNSSRNVYLYYHSKYRIQSAPYSFTNDKIVWLHVFSDKSIL